MDFFLLQKDAENTQSNQSFFGSIASLFGMGKKMVRNKTTTNKNTNENGKSRLHEKIDNFLFQNAIKTRFIDMDEDSMLLIFEQLKFIDLLSIAQTNQRLSNTAAYVAKHKYSNHKMKISSIYLEPAEKHPFYDELANALTRIGFNMWDETITEDEFSIVIKDHETVINTFKYLGVYNLEFYSTYYITKRMKLMGELISEYASDTLETMTFHQSEIVTKFITKPLVNVKSVRFSGSIDLNDRVFSLNTTFPSMQSLHLDVFLYAKDIRFLYHHMPRLERLILYSLDTVNIEKILSKNQQIQNLKVFNISPHYLERLSSWLPNLKTLTLFDYRLNDGEARFENVTTFIAESSGKSPKKLHFPNLKTFHLRFGQTEHLGLWIDFLQKHQQVTTFHLNSFEFIFTDFNQLIIQLPNLVEMTLWITESEIINYKVISDIYSDSFMSVLEKQKKLRVFNLISNDETDRKTVRENYKNMEHKWHITNIVNGLSFERKSEYCS